MKRLVLCLVLAASIAVPSSAHGKALVVADCLTASYKPRTIVLSCAGGEARKLLGLKWTSWGGARAKGTDFTGAKVVLSGKQICRSAQKVYTRVRYKGDTITLGCP
jgi:hypothetical protein